MDTRREATPTPGRRRRAVRERFEGSEARQPRPGPAAKTRAAAHGWEEGQQARQPRSVEWRRGRRERPDGAVRCIERATTEGPPTATQLPDSTNLSTVLGLLPTHRPRLNGEVQLTTTEGFPAHTGSPSPFRHLAGTVLVVDDDEGVLEAMRRTLRHSAFRLITCSCGAAAFEVACREAVDVVVCDLLMPAMDGLEVLDRIHERRPEAIRILMTGQPSAESAIDAINHGEVFRYLTKPLSRDLLEATLTMAFGRLAETRARAAQAAGSQPPRVPDRHPAGGTRAATRRDP